MLLVTDLLLKYKKKGFWELLTEPLFLQLSLKILFLFSYLG